MSIQLTGSLNLTGSLIVGSGSRVTQDGSVAFGLRAIATGSFAFAQGIGAIASGSFSRAHGSASLASGIGSHAEGIQTIASGAYSHCEGGPGARAEGLYSHAEGTSRAFGTGSHAEGNSARAFGLFSHAEGFFVSSLGLYSHAEGSTTSAAGTSSHAEGQSTIAIGTGAHAEGNMTIAIGFGSHAEGDRTTAIGGLSHAEGYKTTAQGHGQKVQGRINIPNATTGSWIVGNGWEIFDNDSLEYILTGSNLIYASGSELQVSGSLLLTGSLFLNGVAITSGGGTVDTSSFVQNSQTSSMRVLSSSFAINASNARTASYVFNLQQVTTAGNETTNPLSIRALFAQGIEVSAIGDYSHAIGAANATLGEYSFAQGLGNLASASYQTVVGRWNEWRNDKHAFIIGNGRGLGESIPIGTAPIDPTYNSLRSNLLFASGNRVEITGSLNVTEDIIVNGNAIGTPTLQVVTTLGNTTSQSVVINNSLSQGISTIAIASGSHAEGFNTSAGITAVTYTQVRPSSFGLFYSPNVINEFTLVDQSEDSTLYFTQGRRITFEVNTFEVVSSTYDLQDTTILLSWVDGDNPNISLLDINVIDPYYIQENASGVSGDYSHAEGQQTTTIGIASHAEGLGTVTSGSYSHTQGQWNAIRTEQSAFIIGNGTSDAARSNLFVALPTLQKVEVSGSLALNIGNYANDAAAESAGVPLTGLYHHNGNVKIRLV